MSDESQKEQMRVKLKVDPGDPVFAEYADMLRLKGDVLAALEVCLAGLSSNPGYHRGRLILAQLFYAKGFVPFAIREVELLAAQLPENDTIRKLLEKLSPGSTISSEVGRPGTETTIAEAEFDIDVIEAIEDEEEPR